MRVIVTANAKVIGTKFKPPAHMYTGVGKRHCNTQDTTSLLAVETCLTSAIESENKPYTGLPKPWTNL